MEVYKDSWHYKAWEYWLKVSKGKRAGKYSRTFHGTTRDIEHARALSESPLYTVVEDAEEDGLHIIYAGKPQQPNLCIYFWVAVLRAPLLRIARNEKLHIAATIALVYGLAALFGNLFFIEALGFSSHPLLVWLVYPFAIIAAAAIIIGLIMLYYRLREWHRFERETAEKGPSILTEYVKANKNKVCPLLEFKEREPA